MQDSENAKEKGKLLAGVSIAALLLVVVAPAAASWHGLVATGRDVFGLQGGWEYVVPLTLDGAALYAGTLAFRAILRTDSAFGPRLLTAIYAGAAAGFNFFHANATDGGNIPAALFFAGASLSAVVLWDVTLRALRRDQLRAAGLIEQPLPRFRLLRWLVAPNETACAWRLAVVEQIHDPAEALHRARTLRAPELPHRVIAERVTEAPALTQDAATEGGNTDVQANDADENRRQSAQRLDLAAGDRGGAVVLGERSDRSGADRKGRVELVHQRRSGAGDVPEDGVRPLSKAEAVRTAFDELGERNIPAALAWLAERGVSVDRSYAYTVKWSPAPPALHAIGGEH